MVWSRRGPNLIGVVAGRRARRRSRGRAVEAPRFQAAETGSSPNSATRATISFTSRTQMIA